MVATAPTICFLDQGQNDFYMSYPGYGGQFNVMSLEQGRDTVYRHVWDQCLNVSNTSVDFFIEVGHTSCLLVHPRRFKSAEPTDIKTLFAPPLLCVHPFTLL